MIFILGQNQNTISRLQTQKTKDNGISTKVDKEASMQVIRRRVALKEGQISLLLMPKEIHLNFNWIHKTEIN